MSVARLLVVVFLILAILFTYSSFIRGEISHAWENARPGVILMMDSFYAAIRNFVSGTNVHDGIDDKAPEVDFDEVITMKTDLL